MGLLQDTLHMMSLNRVLCEKINIVIACLTPVKLYKREGQVKRATRTTMTINVGN